MSDLISRSELYDQLANKLTWLMGYGDDLYLAVGSDIRDVIYNMPTAYDIDKVVEELEKNTSRYTKKYLTPYGNNGYRDTKAISIHKAIAIVKQGCVGKDVE